ncbi:MAG: sigma-70 family RNA polymerase sigma factor [Actinomycetes bacterium]
MTRSAAPCDGLAPEAASLVREHEAMARRLARRFDRGHGDREDLEQVALAALVAAASRHDPERGDFAPYLAATVLGELRHHVRDNAWVVRVPRRLQESALEVRRAAEDLTQTLRRDPTVAELAEALGWSPDEVVEAVAARSASRARAVVEDGRTPDAEESLEDGAAQRLDLADAVAGLGPAERMLLHLRFTRELSQRQIGDELGCSQMQVSRRLTALLRRLRADVLG